MNTGPRQQFGVEEVINFGNGDFIRNVLQGRGSPGTGTFRVSGNTVIFNINGALTEGRLIGFDRNANPIEILYNVLDNDTVRIFHAMKCRNAFKYLLKNG